jgi:hypothetical protein
VHELPENRFTVGHRDAQLPPECYRLVRQTNCNASGSSLKDQGLGSHARVVRRKLLYGFAFNVLAPLFSWSSAQP